MPHFNVQIVEELLDAKVEPQLIWALTDAVVKVYGEQARPLVVVELFGVPRNRWGAGGRPAPPAAAVVSLTMRESGLQRATIHDPPAELVAAITQAMVGVVGDGIREYLHVLVTGIPAGRSGVGGQVVGV